MIAGETDIQPIYLLDENHLGVVFADKAAFLLDGGDLTFYGLDAGVPALLDPQPEWDLGAGTADGRHVPYWVIPLGRYTVKVTVPASVASCSPREWMDEGEAYDLGSIGAQIATSNGVALTPITIGDAATLYHGDSIKVPFAVSAAALEYVGADDLADLDSMVAQIKLNSNSSTAAADATLTTSIVGDAVHGLLDAFPAALALPTGDSGTTLAATAQLRIYKGALECIASEVALTIKWKATTV